MVVNGRPTLVLPGLRTRIALVLLCRNTSAGSRRSPVLVQRSGRTQWCHVLFERSCLVDRRLVGSLGRCGALVNLELRGSRVLLVQVVVCACATFSGWIVQGLPSPGQDGRAVGELSLEVRIDDLTDLKLLTVLPDFLQSLERWLVIVLLLCSGCFLR